ncbi:hypothetical protein ACFL4W_01230 [Planctomycetota bacterium]
MSSLDQQVETVAREAGADLVGFANIERFNNAPRENHPCSIYPQTRSIIAVAVRQSRGSLKTAEEGTYWQAYNCDSYWYLNEVIAPKILRAVVLFLEEKGYTSVQVHNPFRPHLGRQVREDMPDGPDGMISLRVIGAACGLGELGHSKVFLTPQYGPRQRVFAIFTDAELKPTPLFRGNICDGCQECVKGCQANAIGTTRSEKVLIEDREFSHAPLDCQACGPVHQGRDQRFSPFVTGEEKEGELSQYGQFLQHRFRHLSICVARGCIRSCLDHLEKKGALEAKFKTPFIERERWE